MGGTPLSHDWSLEKRLMESSGKDLLEKIKEDARISVILPSSVSPASVEIRQARCHHDLNAFAGMGSIKTPFSWNNRFFDLPPLY
jgi:hypothetical protein